MTFNPGWLREQCLILAGNSKSTSVFEWLSRPLRELGEWIRINNRLMEKEKQFYENARAARGGRKFGPRR